MEEILWNDPREEIGNEDAWEYSRRGIGKHFGVEISRKWLRLSGTKVIVRGHEPCQGYRIDHGGSIMTLFSCKEPYPKFQASYLLVANQDLNSLNDAIMLSQGSSQDLDYVIMVDLISLQRFLKETVEMSATWQISTCLRNSLHDCEAKYITAPANALGFFPIEILFSCTSEYILSPSLFVFSLKFSLFDMSVT